MRQIELGARSIAEVTLSHKGLDGTAFHFFAFCRDNLTESGKLSRGRPRNWEREEHHTLALFHTFKVNPEAVSLITVFHKSSLLPFLPQPPPSSSSSPLSTNLLFSSSHDSSVISYLTRSSTHRSNLHIPTLLRPLLFSQPWLLSLELGMLTEPP